jgi:hypothetical protein
VTVEWLTTPAGSPRTCGQRTADSTHCHAKKRVVSTLMMVATDFRRLIFIAQHKKRQETGNIGRHLARQRHEAHIIFDLSRTPADKIDHLSFVLGPEVIHNNVYRLRTSRMEKQTSVSFSSLPHPVTGDCKYSRTCWR